MTNPSFILPSAPAYDEGNLYGLNVYYDPTNFVASPMTVTRATTATRVNQDGLVELVPYNLFQYSEQFDISNTIWTRTSVNVTGNAVTAPDGTLTADLLLLNAGTTTYSIRQQCISSSYEVTASVYVKYKDKQYIQLLFASAYAGDYANFDLINGNITAGTYTNATIEPAQNGYYRISITTTGATFTPLLYIWAIDSPTSSRASASSSDGTNGYYLWGAQLVEGTDALPYKRTETRLNIPRIDYSLGGCPSVLVEPQRTNLCTYSENMSQDKSISGLTVLNSTSIAPNGLVTADTLTASLANARISTSAATGTTPITFSVYVKAIDANFIQLIHTGDGNCWANFDILNGIEGTSGASTTSSIESVGNGWYRCSAYFNTNISSVVRLYIADNNTSSFGGTTAIIGTSILTWGWQAEAGAYATSYIPTTSASVTRNADVISKTGISSLIGQTEGTLFMDVNLDTSVDSNSHTLISLSDGTTSNFILIYKLNNNQISANIRIGGVQQVIINSSAITTGRYKLAIGYKQDDVVLYMNGIQIGVDTSCIIPSTSVLSLSNIGGVNQSFSRINATTLWKERLTNDQLTALTTL